MIGLSNTWGCWWRLHRLFNYGVVQLIPWIVGCLRGPLVILGGLCPLNVGLLQWLVGQLVYDLTLSLSSKLCIKIAYFVLRCPQILLPVTLRDLIVLQEPLSNFSFVHMSATDNPHLGIYHYVEWDRKRLKSCRKVLDLGCILVTDHTFLLKIVQY